MSEILFVNPDPALLADIYRAALRRGLKVETAASLQDAEPFTQEARVIVVWIKIFGSGGADRLIAWAASVGSASTFCVLVVPPELSGLEKERSRLGEHIKEVWVLAHPTPDDLLDRASALRDKASVLASPAAPKPMLPAPLPVTGRRTINEDGSKSPVVAVAKPTASSLPEKPQVLRETAPAAAPAASGNPLPLLGLWSPGGGCGVTTLALSLAGTLRRALLSLNEPTLSVLYPNLIRYRVRKAGDLELAIGEPLFTLHTPSSLDAPLTEFSVAYPQSLVDLPPSLIGIRLAARCVQLIACCRPERVSISRLLAALPDLPQAKIGLVWTMAHSQREIGEATQMIAEFGKRLDVIGVINYHEAAAGVTPDQVRFAAPGYQRDIEHLVGKLTGEHTAPLPAKRRFLPRLNTEPSS